jgi:hypothetical protein
MNTSRQSRFEAVLARISLGAVPMDGIYWLDPKGSAAACPSKRAKAPQANRVWLSFTKLLLRSYPRSQRETP